MGKTIKICLKGSKSLLVQLREQGYYIPSWCGGKGTCGKCKIRFLHDVPKAKDTDREVLSERTAAEGWRLACKVYAEGTYELEVPDDNEEHIKTAENREERSDIKQTRTSSAALAVDLGTTTIAASLVDTKSRRTLQTVTGINHQRSYGADVLSRIDAANKGEGKRLQALLHRDLNELCTRLGIGDDIEKLSMPVYISGNTTMEHLLAGLSCRTLGVFPYTPVDISMHSYKNMIILPGISTYVGADIVSGIVACGMDQKEAISILIDLGTNGEMAIGNKDRILVASTAAGPAFEGGNISCGTAGIPGAIESVTIRDRRAEIITIDGKAACGICGSGTLETVYELVKENLVDETGLLDGAYFEQGFPLAPGITFTARDVREVQMAKSAVRAGIEILIEMYGISYDQVDMLYLAGGFGKKMNCAKAVGIGMLPEELAGRIEAVGNSSLEGVRMLAKEPDLAGRFKHIPLIAEEIILANCEKFQDLYIENMFFGKEEQYL